MRRSTFRDLEPRILRRPDGCWEWTGARNAKGYGRAGSRSAHRLVYSLLVGPPPQQLHHVCHFRACVNPEHLEAIDPSEHSRLHHTDGGYCLKGHEWTPENTYIRPDKGTRMCRACIREGVRRRPPAKPSEIQARHLRRIRGAENQISCPVCGVPMRGSKGLTIHRSKAGH